MEGLSSFSCFSNAFFGKVEAQRRFVLGSSLVLLYVGHVK
uniref:Uncharacterized protein n=1 Tax=Lepeophtheirus salmonis TaxID=72036 RepID=A0A0K2UDL2_LEPSM